MTSGTSEKDPNLNTGPRNQSRVLYTRPDSGFVAPPFYKKRAFLISAWIAGAAVLCFILVGILVPWIAAKRIEEMTGRSFRFGFLAVSPSGHVSISLQGAQDLNRQIHLDTARVRLDWWSALLKRLRIGYVDLRDARFDIEKTAAGELIVNSVNLSNLSAGQPAPAQPAEPKSAASDWGIGVGRVFLSNIGVNYKEGGLDARLVIERLMIGAAESWRPSRKTPFEADLTLNGGKISIKGEATPFSPEAGFEGTVGVAALPLDWIQPLLADSGVKDLKGFLTVDGQMVSKFAKETGALDVAWSGDVALQNASALYETFRMMMNGPIRFTELKIHQEKETLVYSAASIKNGGPLSIAVRDESFRRAPEFKLNPLTFEVKDLDSGDPDQKTSIDLKAELGKYDRLEISGALTPFAKKIDGDLSASIKELDLSPFTAYAERHAGSRIQTGVFNLETKATIRGDRLDAKNSVLLKRLIFQYVNKQKEEEDTGKIGLPLNVLLSLLKDKNGDISLAVPMEGAVRDPSVGFGPLIGKLIGKAVSYAAKKAATAFFPPLKTIELAGSVAAFATKWRFEPIAFEPGTLQMTGASQNYLDEVGKKLKERPGVTLTICGYGTRADLKQKLKADEKLPELSVKEKDLLMKLASDRGAAAKDFLVGRHGIDSGRLILCTPDIEDAAAALPRSQISL